MSTGSSRNTVLKFRDGPQDVLVRNWPLRDEGWPAWGVVLASVAASVLAGVLSHSLAMGGLTCVALAAVFWRLWVPVTFEISPRGVVQIVLGVRRRFAWQEVARFEVRPRGLLLLAREETFPLAALRGLFIRWDSQRDDLLAAVDFYLRHVPPQGSTKSRSAV